MNFHEEIVQQYLTEELELLTLPDLKVKRNQAGNSWRAQVDFVALDFKARKIYLVEVTGAKDFPEHLVNKLKTTDRETIEWSVRNETLEGQISDEYKFEWWLIVRGHHVPRLKELVDGVPAAV